MPGCPPIDEDSVRRDEFGRIVIPYHPEGGIMPSNNGAYIRPIPTDGFTQGIPTVTVNNVAVDTPANLKNIAGYVRKEDRIVTIKFLWLRQGNYAYDVAGTTLTGIIRVNLPYEADTPGNLHSNAYLLNQNIAQYDVAPVLDTPLLLKFRSTASDITATSPFTFGDQCQIMCYVQYQCKPDADYLWG